MKRTRLIIIAFLLVVIIGVVYLWNRERPSYSPRTMFSSLPNSQVPQAELTIPTGETVSVNEVEVGNFYKAATKVTDYGDAVVNENGNFRITYVAQGKYFLITILSSPFEEGRKQAETQFLSNLNINEESACKLDVQIGTSYRDNPNEAGKTYTLSFCE